jgi:hypothetical protein
MGDENELRGAPEPEEDSIVMVQSTLQNLLKRLENEVGPVDQGFFSAWEGDEQNLAARTAAGKGHFAEAICRARKALASGDAGQIREAVRNCQVFELIGLRLAGKAIEAERKQADEEKLRAVQADVRRDVGLKTAATARKAKEARDEQARNALQTAVASVCEAQQVSMVDSEAFAESIHGDVRTDLTNKVRQDPESESDIKRWLDYGKPKNWPSVRTIRRAIQAMLKDCGKS